MSKDIIIEVRIKYDDLMSRDELDLFRTFHDSSTNAIKRRVVDELVEKFTATMKPEDLDIDLSDVKQLVKQKIIEKAASAAVDALGISNDTE